MAMVSFELSDELLAKGTVCDIYFLCPVVVVAQCCHLLVQSCNWSSKRGKIHSCVTVAVDNTVRSLRILTVTHFISCMISLHKDVNTKWKFRLSVLRVLCCRPCTLSSTVFIYVSCVGITDLQSCVTGQIQTWLDNQIAQAAIMVHWNRHSGQDTGHEEGSLPTWQGSLDRVTDILMLLQEVSHPVSFKVLCIWALSAPGVLISG